MCSNRTSFWKGLGMFQNTRWTRFSTNELQSNEAATQFFFMYYPQLVLCGCLGNLRAVGV